MVEKITNTVKTLNSIGCSPSGPYNILNLKISICEVNTCVTDSFWEPIPNVSSIIFNDLNFFLKINHIFFGDVWRGQNPFFDRPFQCWIFVVFVPYFSNVFRKCCVIFAVSIFELFVMFVAPIFEIFLYHS